jgi:hypothetical protein
MLPLRLATIHATPAAGTGVAAAAAAARKVCPALGNPSQHPSNQLTTREFKPRGFIDAAAAVWRRPSVQQQSRLQKAYG